jgi:hypothetical protein
MALMLSVTDKEIAYPGYKKPHWENINQHNESIQHPLMYSSL